MALLYGFSIVNNQSTTLADGRRAFWLHDDMMITMRYARNLVDGYGLVWNPGQPPVEGYSNFGWLLIMAAVHLLPLPDTLTSLVILLLNLMLAGLVLVLTTRLAQRLDLKPGIWLLAALLTLIVITDLARWTIIGLEVPLLTAVFLWLLIRVLDEGERERPRVATFFMAGLLGLIRIDGLLLAGIISLIAFGLQSNKKRVLAYTPLILLLPLAHLLFRLAYYGYPFPNTYYLKLTAYNLRFVAGFNDLSLFGLLYMPVALFAFVGAFFAKDRRIWLLLFAGVPLAIYLVYIGGDDFGGARFFAPWLPVLFLLGFSAPYTFGWRNLPLVIIVMLGSLVTYTSLGGYYDFYQGPGEEAALTEGGIVLRELTAPETSIGVFWAGTLPYFAHRPVVDMLGKNDEIVARLPANEGSSKPGHNKFDYDYSLGNLRPDLLVSPLSISILLDRDFQSYTVGNDAYSGQLFLDDTFQKEYAPTVLMIGEMPLFIRSDSPGRERLIAAAAECDTVENIDLREFGLETVCWLNGR